MYLRRHSRLAQLADLREIGLGQHATDRRTRARCRPTPRGNDQRPSRSMVLLNHESSGAPISAGNSRDSAYAGCGVR
jgi:hypothetical protein